MLFARAHATGAKGLPETAAEHTLVYDIQPNGTKRAARDAPHTAKFAQNAGTKEAETPNQDQVFGISQDTVVKGQKHFMVAVAGVTPLRIPAGEKSMYRAGVPVGDPTKPGKCIGYALDKARWDPCHDSYVVDVHIAHHYQNDAVGQYLYNPFNYTNGGKLVQFPAAILKKFAEFATNLVAVKATTDATEYDKGQPKGDAVFLSDAEMGTVLKDSQKWIKPFDVGNSDQKTIAECIGTSFWWKNYLQTNKVFPSADRRVQMGRMLLNGKTTEAKDMAKALQEVIVYITNKKTYDDAGTEKFNVKGKTRTYKVTANLVFKNADAKLTYRFLLATGAQKVLANLKKGLELEKVAETKKEAPDQAQINKFDKDLAEVEAEETAYGDFETTFGVPAEEQTVKLTGLTYAAMSAPAAAAAAAAAAEPVAEPVAEPAAAPAAGGAPRPDTGAAKSRKKRRRPRAPDEAPLP